MAYQKKQWQDHIDGVQDGTPVSAAIMNNMEDGIYRAHQVEDSTASALDRAYHPLAPYYSAGATGSSTNSIYFGVEGITTGVYLLLIHGNPNPNGTIYYRSAYAALIGISCGYNLSTKRIVIRARLNPLHITAGTEGLDTDARFKVILDNPDGSGAAEEIPRTSNTYKIFISVSRQSTSSTVDNWDVRLHKLI